jgi:uncharacterized protein
VKVISNSIRSKRAKRASFAFVIGVVTAFGNHAAAQTQPGSGIAELNGKKIVDSDALLRLGDLYYDGEVVETDYAKAFIQYAEAAAAGSMTGKIRMGEMLARGQGTAQDIKRGRAIVSEVADNDSSSALVSLGDLYARGDAGPMDPNNAINSYNKAAALGNTQAMIRLGDLYLYGRFGRANGRKALGYYRGAADAGNPYGFYGLGNIYLNRLAGRAGSLTEGVSLLQQAERAGVAGAIVTISNSYFYGTGKRPNPKRALANLVDAMQQGNVEAGKELVAAYRDGKRDGRVRLVKRDPVLARKHLHQIETKLTKSQLAFEVYLLDSAAASSPTYRKLYDRLQEISVRDRSNFIRELRTVNPRVYVYFVQTKLKELQLFRGEASGTLSAKTSLAMRKFCGRSGTRYFCSKGPMSSQHAEILSYAFQ